MPSVHQVAIIGYGNAGRRFHAYLIGLAAGLRLRGIASRDPQTRQRIVAEQGCLAYESFERALADPQVDLIVLATPHDTHAAMAIEALTAGKHVVTDKVMCLTTDEADTMIEASRRARKLLSVFHNRRLDGDYLTVKKAIGDGELGPVRWIEMNWQRSGPPRGWRGRRDAGGGRLMDLGAHLIDQTIQLWPEDPPMNVYCRMHHDFGLIGQPEIDVESHCMVTIEFASGRTAIIDTSAMVHQPKPRFLIAGIAATLMKTGLDPQEQAMFAGDIDSARDDPVHYARISDGKTEKILPTLAGRWIDFYPNIAEALSGIAVPWVTAESVRPTIAVLQAALRSAQTHQAVACHADPGARR